MILCSWYISVIPADAGYEVKLFSAIQRLNLIVEEFLQTDSLNFFQRGGVIHVSFVRECPNPNLHLKGGLEL
jgi:hypothetical protein